MSQQHILTEQKDRVLTIRFNRPDKKNALTQAMYTELARLFESASKDSAVRSILLTGQPECFSAGNDMKDFLAMPPSAADNPTLRFMQSMAECSKPIVAAPAGIAVGVGVTLLLHCDLVYCGEQTRLHMPFVTLGIRPEFASTYLLPRLVGHVRASELLLLGQFTAQKALEYGLVNALHPNAAVEAVALEKARAIAHLPPTTVRATKALLKHWRSEVVRESISFEMNEVGKSLNLPEALESITAFMQKRKPDFSRFS
jgi:enoyl-CoA hydratase/carnithine racemase